MNTLWIIGPGRCGTQSLAAMLGGQGVHAEHEPEPMPLEMARARIRGEPWDAQRSWAWWCDYREQTKYDHYAESAFCNTWCIREIISVWPDARFCLLLRDIWSWAWSAYRRGWYLPHDDVKASRSLRPVPSAGWPEGVSRWYKLGYFYQIFLCEATAALQETLTPHVVLWTDSLNDMKVINWLRGWAGLPGETKQAVNMNDGKLIVTVGDLKRAGLIGQDQPYDDWRPYYTSTMEDRLGLSHQQRRDLWKASTLGAMSRALDEQAVADLAAGQALAMAGTISAMARSIPAKIRAPDPDDASGQCQSDGTRT